MQQKQVTERTGTRKKTHMQTAHKMNWINGGAHGGEEGDTKTGWEMKSGENRKGSNSLQSLASQAVILKQTNDRDKHGRRERKRTGSSACRNMIDRDHHPPAGQEEEWIKFEGAWWKKIASLPTATNWARGTILSGDLRAEARKPG